jgi:hypothetical protein
MSELLVHDSHTFINFANGTYQWADVHRFRLLVGRDDHDRAILAALIGHDVFGNNYASRPGNDAARHGPYWRARVEPSSYEPFAAQRAEQRLRAWAERHAPLREVTRRQLEHDVYWPLRLADAVYRLRDLGTESLHDWSGVHDEFHEFVWMHNAGWLTLLVAADD